MTTPRLPDCCTAAMVVVVAVLLLLCGCASGSVPPQYPPVTPAKPEPREILAGLQARVQPSGGGEAT